MDFDPVLIENLSIYCVNSICIHCDRGFGGVKKQLDDLVDPNRRMISFVYFGSIIFSVIIALCFHSPFAKFLVVVLVLVQIVAFWWYVLSYIPCGRRIATGCLSCVRSCIWGNW